MTPFAKKETETLLLQLKLSEDGLKLFVDAETKGSHKIQGKELSALILELAAEATLDQAVIDDIAKGLSQGKKCEERRIAKGKEAEEGRDSKIVFLVKRFGGRPEVKESKDKAKLSFTELHLFDNIKKGQTVARIYPPKPGVDGVDAVGKKIAAKVGQPLKVSFDKTLLQQSASEGEERFDTLVADCDGYLTEDAGKLTVKDELVIKGDLDFNYGSINFIGKVTILGDVCPGFVLSADKGIIIQGTARQSRLISSQGNIVVKGFLYGGQGAGVVCAGDFTGSVTQELRIDAAGTITITKESTSCILRTEKALLMPEGSLFGGETYAIMGVECKRIGNEAATATIIRLCSSVEVSSEYERLLMDLENHDKAQKLLELHLGPYAKNTSRLQFLKGPHKDKLIALAAKYKAVQDGRITLLAKKKTMLESTAVAQIARVNFAHELNAGVVITSGEKERFEVKERLAGPSSVVFDPAKGVFEIQPITALAIEPKAEKERKK